MRADQKVMFEIYREAGYGQRYRVVFFTELEEHARDEEINRALAGEHLVDGFLRERDLVDAKQVIAGLLARLNEGSALSPEDVTRALADYSA